MHPQITIVMASYNGARYLPTQLDSILAQTQTNWRLIVSDDGSTDDTCAIIDDYAARPGGSRITRIDGPRQGATANFLHLILQADPKGWIAYCDQDDLWQPDKLARAAAHLAAQDGPAIYAARTTVCDDELRPLAPAPHFRGPFSLRNALVQACLPGNTTVANSAALQLLQAGAQAAARAGVVSHDWWTYQLLSGAGAHIHRDPAQVLLYRQHQGNVMGRNDTTKARAARFSMLFDGTFAGWLAQNQSALESVADVLTPANRKLLQGFAEVLDASGPAALARMVALRLYRQTLPGTLAVHAAALAGKLRRHPLSDPPESGE
ncbi:glycosyltransferase [Paracoccus laeviglucosivorans]|uniref:Glycosyl transferase family 2 n=1 Tax=Paracoccus laeviglucosivorans TaxID=1197861 RepID=A0A521DC41_9RHOB|nr:glycosyltransferase [Paracoccus laeviglucosivorans]SMO69158.1 Glycosyl transferase family 2 [Paracoccus laeviglucosivorans]